MHRFRDNLRTLSVVIALVGTVGMVAGYGTERAVASLSPAVVDTTGSPEPTDPPAPAPTDPPAPAPTDAPVTTAAPGPDTPAETDDGSSSNVVIIVLIVAVAAIALIAMVTLLSGSKSKQHSRPGPQPAGAPQAPSSPQASLLSTSQWINDQLVLELMAAPPPNALARWSVERSRLDNVVIGAQQQYLQVGIGAWQALGQALSTLATSVDTNLRLRAQSPPNAQLISESTDVVNRQRVEVRGLISALAPTVSR